MAATSLLAASLLLLPTFLQCIIQDNCMLVYMDIGVTMDKTKPIGYWLKHLHNLLETQFAVVLDDLGLARRHWQVLNTLNPGPQRREELRRALAPFWTDGEPGLDELLDEAVGHGWAEVADDVVRLTDHGRGTHATAAARIAQARGIVMGGLTPQQYAETVRVLSVMADNVAEDIRTRESARPASIHRS